MNINKHLAESLKPHYYGAPMGRPSYYAITEGERVHCQRVSIDSQGYDRGGHYWGLGDPLYCVFQPHGDLRVFIREKSNTVAKLQVLADSY